MPSVKQLKAFSKAGKRGSEVEDVAAPVEPPAEEHHEATPDEEFELVKAAQAQIDSGPDPKLVAVLAGYDADEEECPLGFDVPTWDKAAALVADAAVGDGGEVDVDLPPDTLLIGTVYRLLEGPLPEAEEPDDDEMGGAPDGDTDDLGADEMGGALDED